MSLMNSLQSSKDAVFSSFNNGGSIVKILLYHLSVVLIDLFSLGSLFSHFRPRDIR